MWLRNRGLSTDEALEAIRAARVGTRKGAYAAPQTDGQVAAIRNFVDWRSRMAEIEAEEA